MKRIRDLRIRTKLLLSYVIVIIICMSFFSVTIFQNSSSTIRNQSLLNVMQTVSLSRVNTLSYMNDIENTLLSVQANKNIQDILTGDRLNPIDEISGIENEFLSVDIFSKKLSSIKLYIFNRPDYPQAYNSSMVFSNDIVINEPWYYETIGKNGEVCWNVFHIQDTKGTIAASRLIINTNTHEPIAVARVDIDILQFLSNIENVRLGKNGKVFIVADNHILNLSSDSYVKDFVNNRDFFNLLQNETISNGYIKINGTEYLINYGNLKGPNIKIVGGVKTAELDESSKFVAKAIVITAIISMLIAFLLLFIFSNYITVPIRRLSNIMKDFGSNTDVQVDIPSNDEIGLLYKSYNSMVSTINNLIADVNILFQKQKISELKALQAQINPHFLYNTLDSINWMAKKYNANDIRMITTSLASFFRHSLNKGQEYTTIENELKQIESYVCIQKFRFKDKFDLEINVDDDIKQYSIIKLSIQPLVENCIVHAFEDVDYNGIIKIEGYREDDFILIKVSDNGKGADAEELNKAINKEFNPDEPIEKYGIHNVNQRIKLYFSHECGLHFANNETGGITATIKMEVKEI